MRIIRNFALVLSLLCYAVANAQAPNGDVEMADKLKADGKIYVVVGVVLIILIGLLLYLVRIERKVAKLEEEMEADNKGK